MTFEEGKVEYSSRGFEQDTAQAMGNDIFRAAIELITNADDAYSDAEGGIEVEVVRTSRKLKKLIVRDKGPGLTYNDLKERLTTLGEETSGFTTGKNVRGFFGRGAKDTTSFGSAKFETIRSNQYSWLEIDSKGHYKTGSEKATEEHYKQLNIEPGSNGFTATVNIERPTKNFTNETFIKRLSTHYQLRRLSHKRRLTFISTDDNSRTPSQLIRWAEPDSEILIDKVIHIAGYIATAQLTVHKLTPPSDGRISAYSKHGIEVRGRTATYDNTLFGYSSPENVMIYGVLTCSHIDELIREYDKGNITDSNPTWVVNRNRLGLLQDHPFVTSLASAVFVELAPILESLKPSSEITAGSQKLRSDLNAACQGLTPILLSYDDEDATHSGAAEIPSEIAPLIIIPPKFTMRPEATRSLTVLSHDPAFPEGIDLIFESSNSQVIYTLPDEILHLSHLPHEYFPDTSIATIRVKAKQNGNAEIIAKDSLTYHQSSSQGKVTSVATTDQSPPVTLEWKNQQISVTRGKERTIILRAPVEFLNQGNAVCEISIQGKACELLDDKIQLKLITDGWLEGKCRINGKIENNSSIIQATINDTKATARIRVTMPKSIGGPNTSITILDEARLNARGIIENVGAGYKIIIYARHAALKDIIGSQTNDSSFQHESEQHVRVALCESIASVIADWYVKREVNKDPTGFLDADDFIQTRATAISECLPLLQKALLNNEPLN